MDPRSESRWSLELGIKPLIYNHFLAGLKCPAAFKQMAGVNYVQKRRKIMEKILITLGPIPGKLDTVKYVSNRYGNQCAIPVETRMHKS